MATAVSEDGLQGLEAVKRSCEQLSAQLRELQAGIDYKQSSLPPNLPVKLKALIEKERAYKAEIEHTKQQHVTSISSGWDHDEVKSKVHTELTTLVGDLEEYKEELKVLVEKADEDLASEKQKLDEHNKINRLLRERLEAQDANKEDLPTRVEGVDRIAGRLKAFLDRMYPLPTSVGAGAGGGEDDAISGSKKRKKSEIGSFKASNGLSLLELLSTLTSRYAMNPQSPFLNVTNYWSPYVDLLVMAGVAEYHGRDPTLLRLVDFE